jgi:hypothetical protein
LELCRISSKLGNAILSLRDSGGKMEISEHQKHLKSIIRLEDRVKLCNRCPNIIICNHKPASGKGSLLPEALLVFESENDLTDNTVWMLNLHDEIKRYFQVEHVYHTFLVRCQPKACIWRQGANCYLAGKLLDRQGICMLTHRPCDAIPVKAGDEEIINCLSYALEEIIIFQPRYVLLFGDRVSRFLLKGFGFLEEVGENPLRYESTLFLPLQAENMCNEADISAATARALYI